MVSAQREITSQLNEQRADLDVERDELEDVMRAGTVCPLRPFVF